MYRKTFDYYNFKTDKIEKVYLKISNFKNNANMRLSLCLVGEDKPFVTLTSYFSDIMPMNRAFIFPWGESFILDNGLGKEVDKDAPELIPYKNMNTFTPFIINQDALIDAAPQDYAECVRTQLEYLCKLE